MDRANFGISKLRTEYRIDPLGVDTRTPRLSWQLQALNPGTRALRQTAWHILVASDSSRLNPADADLWNSGVVECNETVHIEYAGIPLLPRARCCWMVRGRDQLGGWSAWSVPAYWTMGIINPELWIARWIGSGDSLENPLHPKPCVNTLPDIWLRKTFTLKAGPERATAFVASVGFHELYVNGQKVGDAVLTPNVTDNSKRARYVAYEIGPLLHRGDNTIGLWLGTGWSIFSKFATPDKPRAPIVLGQFDFELPGKRSLRIVTDHTWATHPSPSTLIGAWDFKEFGGELVDENLNDPGWAREASSGGNWRPAVEFAPNIIVSSDCAEPNRLISELRAMEVERFDDAWRFDVGRNFSGWIELTIEGSPNDRIEIQFSERPECAMTHGLHSIYIVDATGRGVFRNRFNYGVGRWITVRGLRKPPKPEDLRAWLVRPDYPQASAFTCSVPLLDEIFRTTLWTFENLTLGGYVVDCPHRERMGYGGDAHATTTTGLSAFGLGAFFTKWAEDWRDVQGRTPTWGIGIPPGEAGAGGHEEGNLPYTAPTYWGGGGPAWSGYCVHLPWEVYRRYGDERILYANFGTIERWLAFLETKAEGQLLGRYGGRWDFLGDWLWPDAHDVNGDTRESLFFNNCYWIHNLQIATAIAKIVRRPDLVTTWTRRADELRQAVHAEFYEPDGAIYVNGSQAYLAMALLVELPPPEIHRKVWARLEHEILVVRGGHIHAGITGGAFLFQLLMEAGRDDLIYAMVNREDAPSWGAMLRGGATTFWEAWGSNVDSLLHSSFLFVGAWFIHGVLGIQPDQDVAGFKRFVIRPGVIDRSELSSAQGHYDCIHGRIAVEWRRDAGKYRLDVTIPLNTRASVFMPTPNRSEITESGRPLAGIAGIDAARRDGQQTVMELSSGQFSFACDLRLE